MGDPAMRYKLNARETYEDYCSFGVVFLALFVPLLLLSCAFVTFWVN